MQIPIIRGVIDRRVLVNYRIAPEVLAQVCPTPFSLEADRDLLLVACAAPKR